MAQSLLRCTAYYIIILTICVDQGDGRWREKDKETLKHDIELYRRMAEKIERELETFYDEYPEDRLKEDNVDRIQFTRITKLLDGQQEIKKEDKNVEKVNMNNALNTTAGTFNSTAVNQHLPYKLKVSNVSEEESSLTWPKFKDILLEIGKKYDWKNDRWIKVRQKYKKTKQKVVNLKKITDDKNSVPLHENHNFIYRIVKLNRNKSRRSVVVAVSAVR